MNQYKFTILPVLLLVSLLLCSCDQDAPKRSVIQKVTWYEIAPFIQNTPTYAGTVQAHIETEQAFQILGKIISRRVDVGDIVHQGDILAEIDPTSVQLSVINAQAQLSSALATLNNALLTEQRKRKLVEKSLISQENYDSAEQALQTAKANKQKAKADLDRLKEHLNYTQLTASFDGVIIAVNAEIGQTVKAGQPAFTLAQLEQRDAVIDVPGTLLPKLHPHSAFSVSLQLDKSIQTQGQIRESDPEADPYTRTHQLKIAIDNAPEVFRIGALISVSLNQNYQQSQSGNMIVPNSALLHIDKTNGQASVWVIDPTEFTVSLQTIQIGTTQNNAQFINVLSGLNTGDRIVVSDIQSLSEGQKIALGQRMQ